MTLKARMSQRNGSAVTNITVGELLLGADDILCRVGQGESFTIVRNGLAMANLTPSQPDDIESIRTAIENIQAARKHTLSDEMLAAHCKNGRK